MGVMQPLRQIGPITPSSKAPIVPFSTLVLHDDFVGTNATLLTAHAISPVNTYGATWGKITGFANEQRIQTNRGQNYLSAISYNTVNPGLTTFKMEAQGFLQQSNSSLQFPFKVVDSNNYLYAIVNPSGSIPAGLTIIRRVASVSTTVVTVAHTYNILQYYTIELTRQGDTTTITCDGATVSWTDAALTGNTVFGFGTRRSIDHLEYIKVYI